MDFYSSGGSPALAVSSAASLVLDLRATWAGLDNSEVNVPPLGAGRARFP